METGGKKLHDRKPSYPPSLNSQGNSSSKSGIRFSFKFFNHTTHPNLFGIGSAKVEWFISIFERLQSIEYMELSWEDIHSGKASNKTLRCHPINWSSKGIPIKRDEFSWLPKEVRENEEEFPFFQMSISKASGRIIGFFHENTFYIIIFDHNHNLQPSKKYNYQIRNTTGGVSEYDDLLSRIASCETCSRVGPSRDNGCNVVYHYLDNDFYNLLCESKHSPQEIYEAGLLYLDGGEEVG
jgi:hypothetical protein